jgi:hypothetical protein
MSADDNSASESDETQFDDEVQGPNMPISRFSIHFLYTLIFLHVHVYTIVEVKILGFPLSAIIAVHVLGFS